MKPKNLKVGQPIFFKPLGNRARGGRGNEILEATIASVATKFFTVKNQELNGEKFFIDSLMHNGGQYSPQYKGYLSKQDILDETEREKLLTEIRNKIQTVGQSNITLDQCKGIFRILSGNNISIDTDMNPLLLAVEFGYKCCEKGENLDKALTDYKKLRNQLITPNL